MSFIVSIIFILRSMLVSSFYWYFETASILFWPDRYKANVLFLKAKAIFVFVTTFCPQAHGHFPSPKQIKATSMGTHKRYPNYLNPASGVGSATETEGAAALRTWVEDLGKLWFSDKFNDMDLANELIMVSVTLSLFNTRHMSLSNCRRCWVWWTLWAASSCLS